MTFTPEFHKRVERLKITGASPEQIKRLELLLEEANLTAPNDETMKKLLSDFMRRYTESKNSYNQLRGHKVKNIIPRLLAEEPEYLALSGKAKQEYAGRVESVYESTQYPAAVKTIIALYNYYTKKNFKIPKIGKPEKFQEEFTPDNIAEFINRLFEG